MKVKSLLLMRHAKSDHAEAGLTDHDRPLNPRGRRTAPLMARLLHDQSLTPDWIISSTAVRAHETAKLMAQSLDFPLEIDRRHSLYLTHPRDYIQVLRSLPDELNRPLVVGHNPTLEVLIAHWRDDEEEAIPTAAIALFELPIESWSDLQLDTPVRFRHLWKPKELDY